MLGQALGRTAKASKCLRSHNSTQLMHMRCFATSPALSMARRDSQPEAPSTGKRRTVSVLEEDLEDVWDAIEDVPDVEDAPSSGHMLIQKQRELLRYMRLIEHEIPKLVAYRKDFVPREDLPLVVRSMHYQGESHPATVKRVVVVAVDKLPLKGEAAVHKFILLAGPRWTPTPPSDAGVNPSEDWGNGFIKISCEDFPKPSQNLKWASDTLDKLIQEANDGPDKFSDVPIDMRHVFSKVKKQKKGDHVGNRVFQRPSIRDFPKEWLPEPQPTV